MKMSKRRFHTILERAIEGDHNAMEEILRIYAPLLNYHSRSYGYIDDDCLQYLKLRVVMAVPKFKI